MEKTIEALKHFVPMCEQEEADKEIFLDCAKRFPKSLTRESQLFHFTSSAVVLNEGHDKICAIHHNLYNSWGWMGGHADGEEDLLKVARTEVEEECGIKNLRMYKDGIFSLESMSVFSHFKKGKYVPAHVHLNVTYVFVASEDEVLRIRESENSDVSWFSFKEFIEKSTEEYMKPIYKKIFDRIEAVGN